MARLKLLLWPNQKLREVSEYLTKDQVEDEAFKAKLKDLHETLLHFRGVGLSAIQVDWPVRLFVMRTLKEVQTFVNPDIISTDGELELVEEGCLSLPGVFERVQRYPNVVMVANNLATWDRVAWDMEGIEAQCAQHEVEHLNGKMMSDGWGTGRRELARGKIRKQLKFNPLFK